MLAVRTPIRLLVLLAVGTLGMAFAARAGAEAVKTEHFDRDPGWEGAGNRTMPNEPPVLTQDFGYSETNIAGKGKGEIGGAVCRSVTPAYYAAAIGPKTLNDRLSASGTFAITRTSSSAGVFFGWFNAKQTEGTGRPVSSLGMHFDAEPAGGRLAVRMINAKNLSCGTFITKFEHYHVIEKKAEMRPTPIRNDGTRYTWKLDYDPAGNNGGGRFEFVVTSNAEKKEDFEGKVFAVNLPPGLKDGGATFDRFGLANMTKSGHVIKIYFDDLTIDGKGEDFSKDPGWVGQHNRETIKETMWAGHPDFGYSGKTNFAGGEAGEVGGNFWRGKFGYYADRVGPLTMNDRLEAKGKVMLVAAGPDADMCVGWFGVPSGGESPDKVGSFVGVHVGGPTRMGHPFVPFVRTGRGSKGVVEKGPAMTMGKAVEWSVVYDPAGGAGRGSVRVTLGGESAELVLKPGMKEEGGRFDRFGVFSIPPGGQLVRIYFDDISYTAGK